MFKVLRGIIVTVFVIAFILVIAVIVVGNLTPAKMKLAEKKIYKEYTLNSLGLGKTKNKELFKYARALVDVREEKIVKNSFDDGDKVTIETYLNSSNIPQEGDAIDYGSLINTDLSFDQDYLLTLSDSSLAYAFNQTILNYSESGIDNGNYNIIEKLKIQLEEITFNKDEEKAQIRLVMSSDVSEIKKEVEKKLGFANKWIKMPKKIFFVSYLNVEVTSSGALVTTSDKLLVNDKENALVTAFIKILVDEADITTDDGAATINSAVGFAFCEVINNIGKIGTAETTSVGANKIITGDEEFGIGGFNNHYLTMIVGA